MARLSTRRKRKLSLTTTRQHRYWKGTVPGRQRMKSFPTEEAAKEWGKAQGLKAEAHLLHQLPGGKWQWRERNPRLA